MTESPFLTMLCQTSINWKGSIDGAAIFLAKSKPLTECGQKDVKKYRDYILKKIASGDIVI